MAQSQAEPPFFDNGRNHMGGTSQAIRRHAAGLDYFEPENSFNNA